MPTKTPVSNTDAPGIILSTIAESCPPTSLDVYNSSVSAGISVHKIVVLRVLGFRYFHTLSNFFCELFEMFGKSFIFVLSINKYINRY